MTVIRDTEDGFLPILIENSALHVWAESIKFPPIGGRSRGAGTMPPTPTSPTLAPARRARPDPSRRGRTGSSSRRERQEGRARPCPFSPPWRGRRSVCGRVELVRAEASLHLQAQADKAHGHGADRLWDRLAGVLGAVRVDGETVDASVAEVPVLLLRDPPEGGPAPGRGPDIAVGRPAGLRQEDAAPRTRSRVLIQFRTSVRLCRRLPPALGTTHRKRFPKPVAKTTATPENHAGRQWSRYRYLEPSTISRHGTYVASAAERPERPRYSRTTR